MDQYYGLEGKINIIGSLHLEGHKNVDPNKYLDYILLSESLISIFLAATFRMVV